MSEKSTLKKAKPKPPDINRAASKALETWNAREIELRFTGSAWHAAAYPVEYRIPTLAREAGLIEELSRMGTHDELSDKPIARGSAPTAAEAIAAMIAVSWKRKP